MLVQLEDYNNAFKKALSVLKKGGIIIYPTDTLYGLGADATNEESVKKIIKLKGRDEGKPISILVSSIDMLKEYCKLDEEKEKLIESLLPGPLTVVLEKKEGCKLASSLSKTNKVGVRVPEHFFARTLVKELKKPITTTSANKSGSPAPASVWELDQELVKDVDLVVDGGRCMHARPSTVVDLTGKKPVILRSGVLDNAFKR